MFVSIEIKRKENASCSSSFTAMVLQSVRGHLEVNVLDLVVVVWVKKFRMVESCLGNVQLKQGS